MQVALIYSTPNVESLIERCGRICYRSESKTTETSAIPLIRGLLASGHESVIEHSRFCFELEATEGVLLDLLLASPHLKATERAHPYGRYKWLISGNARAWRDAWDSLQSWDIRTPLYDGVPVLFQPAGAYNPYPIQPHTTIDQTANVELWALHIPDGLSREEMLAHGAATVYLNGVSRALTHQLVRHRTGSFSMASQRYCMEGEFEYVTPPSMKDFMDDCDLLPYLETFSDLIQDQYKYLVKEGIPKEDARYILPNAACTEIAVTMTLQHWQHFFELRCDKHSQWEIRNCAEQIKSLFQKHIPQVFEEA